MLTRRNFVLGSVIAAEASSLRDAFAGDSMPLPAWSPGELDIHHIDTGRGNCTFLIAPDGTTVLIDCGASNDGPDVSAPPRPNNSRPPAEWAARYALHHARAAGRNTLDYLIATHIHPDHVGDLPPDSPTASSGFVPTGVSQFDQFMPALTVIDRSFPDYGDLPPVGEFARNYLAWLDSRRRAGRRVERAEVGSDRQIGLRSPEKYPDFSVRVLAANGRVWTGVRGVLELFPHVQKLPVHDRPNENMCSIALHLRYGRFSYFSGGDLTAETRDGRLPWMDVESPVAEAAGRVDVALANHHGYFDSCGPGFTKALDAQVYVIPAWHVTHPGPAQIERLLGAWPGQKLRDVFSTELLPANRLFNDRWTSELRGTQGHVVVRVAADRAAFRVFVLDSTRENGPVVSASGPYATRG